MITALLALIALLLTGYALLFAITVMHIRSVFKQFVSFITSTDDKTESPASILYGVLIKRAAVEFKMVLMGSMGGEAKGQAYAEQAVMQDMIQTENPTIAAVISAFPSLGKTLKKNPALLNYAMSKIAGAGAGKPVAAGATSSDNGAGFASNPSKYG